LLAAYLVALQALLLPLTVAGTPLGTGLCLSAEHGSSPVGDQSACPCSAGCGMQCATPLLATPPSIGTTGPDVYAAVVPPMPAVAEALPAPRWQPHSARAPPVA
jgi:hypothetical protein